MAIITRKRSDNYAIIPNDVANDNRLTFEARGMLVYLLAKPHDWKVHVSDIRKAGRCGRDKAYRVLDELIDAGYLEREQKRDATGKIISHDYVVYDDPVPTELPLPENPDVAYPLPENPNVDQPLPENPLPANPLPENPDGYKELTKQNTDIKKIPTQLSVPGSFEALWKTWSSANRPKQRDYAQSHFDQLPAKVDRDNACRYAKEYQRIMALRRQPAMMVTYLRERAWKELIDAPSIDRDGEFVITPDREEWSAWLGAIRQQYGQPGVDSAVRIGKIVRPVRWPPLYPDPQDLISNKAEVGKQRERDLGAISGSADVSVGGTSKADSEIANSRKPPAISQEAAA